MTRKTPINAHDFAPFMDLTAKVIHDLPFYKKLVELHINYNEGKMSDKEYGSEMNALIVANPDYAEELNHLKTRLLAHI